MQNNIPSPLLTTERLVITRFNEGMAHQAHVCSLDCSNRRFMPDEVFETCEDALDTIKYLMSVYRDSDGPLVFPVLLKSGTYLGHVEAVPISEGFEIGYHISSDYTSNGYATEAVRAFIPYITERLGVDRIFGIVHADNTASARVLEKCGFVLIFDGDGVYHGKTAHIRKYVRVNDNFNQT